MAEHRFILKNNQYTNYPLIFQDRPMFSDINGKLSPRPFDDMVEHKPIFKNNQNTNCPLIFQDRPMFSHINGELSPIPFQ